MVTVTWATGVSVLQVVAATGCGLVAGLLFVFSAGVLTALGRLPPDDGAAAMRAVNTAVLNPLFLGVTVTVNVPLNEALAAGRVDWAAYRRRWGRWNDVRTTAATVALVVLVAA